MKLLSVIQPHELGDDFYLEEGIWKVKFKASGGGSVGLSADGDNALTTGTDGGIYLPESLLNAYALVQDNGSAKINLYRFQAGEVFNIETAELVSSVNLIELRGVFDDVAIDGAVITFTDADSGLTLSIDTDNLQKVSDIVGSNTISVNSLNGVTTLGVKVSEEANNAITVKEDGLHVTGGSGGELVQTLAEVEDGLCFAIGDQHLVVPQILLADINGSAIGYINDVANLPATSVTAGPEHCSSSNQTPMPVGYSSSHLLMFAGGELWGDFDLFIDDVFIASHINDQYSLLNILTANNSPIKLQITNAGSGSGDGTTTLLFTNTDTLNPHTLSLIDHSSGMDNGFKRSGLPTKFCLNETVRLDYDKRGRANLKVSFEPFEPLKSSSCNFVISEGGVRSANPDSEISSDGIDLELTINNEVISGFLASSFNNEGGLHEWDTFTQQILDRDDISIEFGLHLFPSGSMNGGESIHENDWELTIVNHDLENDVKFRIKGAILGAIDVNGVVPPEVKFIQEGTYELDLGWKL